ncbi:MAG: hypothetical protein V4527_08040 [Pseudomonadota bacterium]
MQCFSQNESSAVLGDSPLAVLEHGHIGLAEVMARIEARPQGDFADLGGYIDNILRWFPPNTGRIVFLKDWGFGALAQPYSFVMAAREGQGEHRQLKDAPIHYFPPLSWTWDASEETNEQKIESGLLSGLLIAMFCFGWDGWFVAPNCPDAIEFWEGNIFFYSDDAERLKVARDLCDNFGFGPKAK